MRKVKVRLRPVIHNINLPTVIKKAVFPGSSTPRLFIATQPGEILTVDGGVVETFLDIRPQVLKLGETGGGYDERGLLGMAFHPDFSYNGLFYIHYTLSGSQGPGALPGPFTPDPCDMKTLNLKWTNRETQYDHIDTVEEWSLQPAGRPRKMRTLLNLRRPFLNHNGVNSLNFSPETGRLVLTTGDGGSGYDPFNLSQNDMEIAGKIIEIDTENGAFTGEPPIATRFDELPAPIQQTLTVIAKGARNTPGISYQKYFDRFIKYAGFTGQDLVEAIFSFVRYLPVPVTRLVQEASAASDIHREGFINFGWRGYEGIFPTSVMQECPENPVADRKAIAYYDEAVKTSLRRILPLTSYFHQDPRPDRFSGTALTGVQAYMGNGIPALTGSVVFTDLVRKSGTQAPARGVLTYTHESPSRRLSDFSEIEIDHDFGSRSAYFVSLGTNIDQTRLYLGVYGSMNVADLNLGSVFEVVQ